MSVARIPLRYHHFPRIPMRHPDHFLADVRSFLDRHGEDRWGGLLAESRVHCRRGIAVRLDHGQLSHRFWEIARDKFVGRLIDQHLLDVPYRQYSEKYWQGRKMAPSSLIFYLGINKKITGLKHHNLFFDEDFAVHGHEIYKDPQWPSKPLFYLSMTSSSDPTVAPAGCDNLFILIPVAPGLKDNDEIREKYYDLVMDRLENLTKKSIRDHVIVKKSYCLDDFKQDYNAFKGNAYGLANTLKQTAILKPSMKSKRVKNLYYTGQLTVPGPGVPPAIISGQVVADQIKSDYPITESKILA